jgi:hypothetical protein
LLRAFGSDESISAAAPPRASASVCRASESLHDSRRDVCFRVEAEPLGHQPHLEMPLIVGKPDAIDDLTRPDVAYLQRSVRHVSRRLAQASDEIVVRLLVSGDWVVTTAYELTSLPVRSSISDCWIDRTEFRNSRQLNISDRNLANSRSIVSSMTVWSDSSESRALRSFLNGSLNIVHAVGRVKTHVLQVAGEHIGKYPLQARNVGETAAGSVAEESRDLIDPENLL